MAAPALGIAVPDVFEEHLEAVGFAWTRRRAGIRHADYTSAEITELDEAIEANVDGLIAAGDGALPVLEAELGSEEPLRVFAAAFALLRTGTPRALGAVHDAFVAAAGERLNAMRDALSYGPAAPLGAQLSELFLSGPPVIGAAAGEALAFQGSLTPAAEHLARFLRAEEPVARAAGWRLATYCSVTLPAEWYEAGLRDDAVDVTRAVWLAAAWNRPPTFYHHARALAAEPTPERIEPLTVFGSVAAPEDYSTVGAIAANPAAGADRFRVIGAFGHPYFIELLVKEMENPDPASTAAAAAAFEKMTGRAVGLKPGAKESADGGAPKPRGDAQTDAPFVPDPDSARTQWAELTPALGRSSRICRGMDVSQPLSREQFALLDMESRYEYCLRMRLFSGWQGTPLVLERYPQRF